jgi:hypothetical protein
MAAPTSPQWWLHCHHRHARSTTITTTITTAAPTSPQWWLHHHHHHHHAHSTIVTAATTIAASTSPTSLPHSTNTMMQHN